MKIKKIVIMVASLVSSGASLADYQGKGGMAMYDVSSEAYVYHYENGFTAEDAMSWDPGLRFVWSRVGAAKTCGVSFNKEKIIDLLIVEYGDPSMKDDFMERFKHDMNGIEFHYLQSKKIDGFCSDGRLDEIKRLVPMFEAGGFIAPA